MIETMYLKITDNCNLNCPFCYNKKIKNLINVESATKAIYQYNPKRVVFHGGEPLLYPEIINKIIDEFPLTKFSITTNFTMKLTEERKKVLDRCEIATSYSIDRFENQKEFDLFVENASQYKPTLLITISENQLSEKPIDLMEKIDLIDPSNITLERLFDTTKGRDFYKRTDEYIGELFKLIPKEKNNLLKQFENAIKNNTTVYPTNCEERVITINALGMRVSSCPNLCYNNCIKKIRKECLECEVYMYCRGDCYSYKYECCFPKETFLEILSRK